LDLTYILDQRLAVGGGLWTADAMAALAGLGFTHIVNLQAEFDDSALAAVAGLAALWIPTEDDLQPKPAEFFERAARFALQALKDQRAQVYVHCAAGVHRGPLATAAILCELGYTVEDAVARIASLRIGADFPDVYLESLRSWRIGKMGRC
jgi:protein-tyrosine phosphatase